MSIHVEKPSIHTIHSSIIEDHKRIFQFANEGCQEWDRMQGQKLMDVPGVLN